MSSLLQMFWENLRVLLKTHLTFICSKLTIKTLEKAVKHVQSYQQKHRVFIVSFETFHTFYQCFYC